MFEITFNADGKVRVFIHGDATLSVTAPVNQLIELLPAAIYREMRDRCAALLDATLPVEPKQINERIVDHA